MKNRILTLIIVLMLIAGLTLIAACGEDNALSAYEIAVNNGFAGTEAEWLESLAGTDGLSAYELAVAGGYTGTEDEWLASLQGENGSDGIDGEYAGAGLSAYEIAVENGFAGTEEEWLNSLIGETGATGLSNVAYATNKALLSIVSVYSNYVQTVTTEALPGHPASTYDYEYSSAGSGVILSDDKVSGDAYIITNYHVVYDASSNSGISDEIYIYLYGMEYEQYAISAEYVGGSLTYDIAVLKIDDSEIYKESYAVPAELGSCEDDVYAGNTAIAVGNPEASGISASAGIISIDSEYITMTGADDITEVTFRVMRIDTAVNGGNSGGGLFDGEGKLIGIVNAKISSSDIENIAYAIPVDIAVYAANNIIQNASSENTSIKRCLIGVSLKIAESYAYYDSEEGIVRTVETVSVDVVSETGAAYGILQAGDIITGFSYNGVAVEITRMYTLIDYSLNFVQGEVLTLNIIRESTPMSLEITLSNITIVA